MQANQKLQAYLKRKGLHKKWFREQLGMPSTSQFSQFMQGMVPLPKKFWVKMIILTQGQVTFGDLIADHFKDIDFVEVTIGYSKTKCEVSIKNSETLTV